MIVWLILSLLLALACALLGRALARRRGRNVFAWGLAGAVFPPLLLMLWALPARKPA